MNHPYAAQIARDWNTTDENSGYCGFVTTFSADDAFVAQYPVQVVGSGKVHRELWVPAEDLAAFNDHIEGAIGVVEAFYGDAFGGERHAETDLPTSLASQPARAPR